MLKSKIAVTAIVLTSLLAAACLNAAATQEISGGRLQVVVELSPDTVTRGDNVTIFAAVKDDGGYPVEGATVTATIGDLEILFLLSDRGNGNYQVTIDTSIVKEGSYEIVVTVEKGGYEPSQTSQTLTVLSSALISDLNQDGRVDIFDVIVVASAFGTESGDSRWRKEADINGDGNISILDLAKIALDFGRTNIPSEAELTARAQ